MAATEVKRLADSLFDKDGNSTNESEFVRTALQGLAGCASGAAGGSSDCGSAAAGASASVIVNLLINSIANDNSADDEPRFDADGNLINPLSLEEQQARTNLVTTIIAGIATAAGIDAPGAVTAAQIETENNQNKPGSVGPGNTSFDTSCREVGQGPCGGLPLDRFKDVQEGDVLPNGKIVTAEDVKFYRDQYNDVFNSLYAYNGAPPTEAQVLIGLEVIIEGGLIEQRFAGFVQSFGGLNALENRLAAGGVSAAELAQKYISYERLKAVAFKETPLADISYFENDPAAFDALVKSDPQRAALIQLAVAFVNENTTTAIFNGKGSFGDRIRIANDEFDLVTRGLGLVQGVFSGGAAIVTGTGAVASGAACPATLGAGCVGAAGLGILTVIEADQSLAGFRTFFSGDSTNSFLAQGANALTGIDADKADIILGLGAGGASIAVGVRSGVKLADEGVENLDLAGSFGNAAEISDEALAAGRVVKNQQELINGLINGGIRVSPENIIGIVRVNGRTIWLETGNVAAGLQHITTRHALDFAKKGIGQNEIPDLIFESLSRGTIVGTSGTGRNVRNIYEVVYNGVKQRTAIAVGDNGFIVTAFPQ